ncbi:MAG: MFS transporter [Syntrophales bacterium]|nr:MFS transporter [Syntrophales bacterium]
MNFFEGSGLAGETSKTDESTKKQNVSPFGRDCSTWFNRNVIGAGITSALGDFCYETATVILPGFFAVLGIPAALLGVIEGIADAVASFTKLIAGYLADKLGYRKLIVIVGYALTPIGQVFIALAAGWPLVLLGRVVSWFGKGLRGPLRDAIVAQSVTSETRGRAFGFHRATDTIGAVVGPLLGVTLIGLFQDWHWHDSSVPFRLVFLFSLVPGLLAPLTFLILVKDPQLSPNPAMKFFGSLRELPGRFKRYLIAVVLFGIGDFSHSLLILTATVLLGKTLGIVKAVQVAGLLYTWRNVVQVTMSYPVGFFADRVGHLTMLIAGYMLGALTAILAALAFWFDVGSVPLFVLLFFIAGSYMAMQETLESTVTAEMVRSETLTLSYGVLGTVNGVTKLISSSLVGILWTFFSPVIGFTFAAFFMIVGVFTLVWLRTHEFH